WRSLPLLPSLLPDVVFPVAFTAPATAELYTLSLHDALPIYLPYRRLDRSEIAAVAGTGGGTGTRTVASYDEDTTTMGVAAARRRSEEHTSELQSRENLVCRLLLEKKKDTTRITKCTIDRHRT